MNNNNEAMKLAKLFPSKKVSSKKSKDVWDQSIDATLDYHIVETKMFHRFEKIGATVEFQSFADRTLINHVTSEIDFELARFENRLRNTENVANLWWRSSYPKFIVWLTLIKATLEKKMMTTKKVSVQSDLSVTGVRSIINDARELGYVDTFVKGNCWYFSASNLSMKAYIARLRRESRLTTLERTKHHLAFDTLLNYIDDTIDITNTDSHT